MLKFLKLQYRRLAFGTFFKFLSGIVFFVDGEKPLWLALAVALFFALICLVLAIVGIAIFPRYRILYEMLSIVFLAFTVIDKAFPVVADTLGDTGRLVLFMLAFAVMEHFSYGAGRHKLPAPARWTGKSAFTTDAPPDQVWARLVPNPEAPEDYYSGLLKEMVAEDDAARFRVLWRSGGSNFTVQNLEITEHEPHRRYAYRYGGLVSEPNQPMNSGTWELTLRETDTGGTEVTAIETIERTHIGLALFLWFDNWASQVSESAAAALQGRKDRSIFRIIRKYVNETS